MSNFDDIKKRAQRLRESYAQVELQNKKSSDAYWMVTDRKVMKDKDTRSVKTTISPTPANMIDGAVRLMTSTEPIFSMDVPTETMAGDKDKCENLAKTILHESNAIKRSPIQVDAARSALLWSDVHIRIKCLEDMLKVKGISKPRRARLERIAQVTPYLIETIKLGYPMFDADMGLVGYLSVRNLLGDVARLEYGGDNWQDTKVYEVWDWLDEEYRVVWLGSESEPLNDWNDKHGLDEIPIAVAVSEGTELFDTEAQHRRPFLFKYLEAGLWERETAALTTMFTSMHERGIGPLVAIEPDDSGNQEIVVNWAGSVRYIIGRVNMLNDKAYDADILRALDLLNTMAGESLLFRQALGQPLAGSNPAFSTVALMNTAGRLPLVSPSETVGKVIGDAMSIILRRIRKEGAGKFLKTTEVPEQFHLTATLEVKLPQDQLRNAQIASTLTQGENPLTSAEWVQQNVLGINDPSVVTKQILKERYMALRFMAMAQQFVASQSQPQQPQQPSQPPPMEEPMPGGPMPGGPMPEGQEMPIGPGQEPGMMGGPGAGMAGGEQLPMTGPMPQEPGGIL